MILTLHSNYSLMLGLNSPSDLAKACAERGHKAAALTDHMSVAGAVEFYEACKANNIRPILGCHFDNDVYVLARNQKGWYKIMEAISDCNQTDVSTDEVLQKHITSENHVTFLYNPKLHGKEVYYINKEDAELQRILIASKLGRTLPILEKYLEEGKDFEFSNFFKSDKYYLPKSNPELDESTVFEDYEIFSNPNLPHYAEDEFEALQELCRKGWKEKLTFKNQEEKDIYTARIKEELDVIKDANLSGYFLIVQDIVNYCRERGWLPGIGRGSAAGCLISYLVGITGLDPIPYKLLFSRFYNASRAKGGALPDIDVDVPSSKRDEVIEYIKQKYGHSNVSQMVTFNKLMGKSAVKEVLRMEDTVSFTEMNDMTMFIPNEAEITDSMKEQGETSIIRWSLKNRPNRFGRWVSIDDDNNLSGDFADTFAKAIAIEGTPKSQSKHPAGVIISPTALKTVCPIVKDTDGEDVAGFEMNQLEKLGHVKFDILGVSVLDKIMEVAQDGNLNIDDFNDHKTWDMLSRGDTKGVFQLERQSRWTEACQPRSIDHLAALTAIIRPGVVEALEDGKSMTRHYIDRKNGKAEVPSIHPDLDELFKDTYGVLVYQETAMLLAQEIGGFSLNEADILRKAIGKKKVELMAQVRENFLTKSKEKGKYDEELYTKIFDWIEKSQRYSFNASHSYSYGITAYYTAYCKANNLAKFYEVYLNRANEKPDPLEEVNELINDAMLHNIKILPPNLCNFNKTFTKVDDNSIYFGVSRIKGIGEKECDKIFEIAQENEICDMTWLELLIAFNKIKKTAVEALISVGAFNNDQVFDTRNKLLFEYGIWKQLTAREILYIENNCPKNMTLSDCIACLINDEKSQVNSRRLAKVASFYQILISKPHDVEDNMTWVAQKERELLGRPLTCSASDEGGYLADTTCKDVSLGNIKDKSEIALAGELISLREHKIKKEGKLKNKTMAFIDIEDSSGKLSISMFPDDYAKYKELLYEKNALLFKAYYKNGNLYINEVIQI